ncbi:MAG: AMP-binding protein, partial [Tepidisphaeraceae bacterium]
MANLYDQLQEQARTRPGKVAIEHCQGGGRAARMTFGELGAMAAQFAAALGREERTSAAPGIVPIFMGKSPACVAAMIGAIGAGRAFACLNRKLRPPQLNAILQATGAGTALTDGAGVMALGAGLVADSAIARTQWWVVDDAVLLPAQTKMVEQMRTAGRVAYWHKVNTNLAMPADDSCEVVHRGKNCGAGWKPAPQPQSCLSGDGAGCCLFTSGSTGNPKGVLIAEADLRARADAEVECFGITSDDILLNVLPFSFDVGLNQLLTAIVAGCSIVLLDSWL